MLFRDALLEMSDYTKNPKNAYFAAQKINPPEHIF